MQRSRHRVVKKALAHTHDQGTVRHIALCVGTVWHGTHCPPGRRAMEVVFASWAVQCREVSHTLHDPSSRSNHPGNEKMTEKKCGSWFAALRSA